MSDANDPDEAAFEEAARKHVPGYLRKRLQDLAALRAALAHGALADVKDIGHRLAGSGSSYGFDSLSQLGRALEASATDEDREAVSRLITALEAALADASRQVSR